MTELLQFDEQLFQLINGSWHTPFLDAIMPYWREKTTWIPLYLFLVIFLAVRFKYYAIPIIIGVVLTIGIGDQMSSQVVKKSVQRLRPCNDPDLKNEVALLVSCGSGYSFTSSHATNHFAIATFLTLVLGIFYRWIRWPLFFWAASISYGQVYVGVHYPLDVIAGAFLGIIIGSLVAWIYWKTPWNISKPDNQSA